MNQFEAGKAYSEVERFNLYAGQLENVTKESIALQLDLIQEEYLESVAAFDAEDPVEMLDGAIDMFVVVSGLLQKMQAAGYDVAKGMEKVTENNLSKFTLTPDNQFAKDNNYSLNVLYQREEHIWSYRDKAGKLRKGPDYTPVDLSGYVPAYFFKND